MPALIIYGCRYAKSLLKHVCNVLLWDSVKKSEFECCFGFAKCISERQARTFANVKTWVFSSINIQWWSFLVNLVYCNVLRSRKAAFREVQKAMLTVAILVPMFTITIRGPYNRSIQSKIFLAKSKLKVKLEGNVLDKSTWMFKCYWSQSYSQTYLPRSWQFFLNCSLLSMKNVLLANLIQ